MYFDKNATSLSDKYSPSDNILIHIYSNSYIECDAYFSLDDDYGVWDQITTLFGENDYIVNEILGWIYSAELDDVYNYNLCDGEYDDVNEESYINSFNECCSSCEVELVQVPQEDVADYISGKHSEHHEW